LPNYQITQLLDYQILMVDSIVRVGVLGAGAWARGAHLPGYRRDPRCKVVAIADTEIDRAREAAREFDIPDAVSNAAELLHRGDIDLIDVCTPSHTHFELAWSALEAGKHVLCEKPVAYDFRDTRRARDLARQKGLKTKVGLTFRYSPAMRYVRELIADGFIGTPFIFNGYEQNSQWLDPMNPLRQVDPDADQSILQVSSLEGYGAPIIDLAHLFAGSDLSQVVGTMRNFIPERMVRQTGRMMRMNIDDGDIFLGEFENGALCSVQTSFVTVGNYPGIEARVYGSKGALVCRLVEEAGICETLRAATPDQVEFRELDIPARCYPPGGNRHESWRTLFYANLVSSFIGEILSGGEANEGDFGDGAWVQEVINAVEQSFRERRWVSLPLAP
jgi:predicted dehydrogenase